MDLGFWGSMTGQKIYREESVVTIMLGSMVLSNRPPKALNHHNLGVVHSLSDMRLLLNAGGPPANGPPNGAAAAAGPPGPHGGGPPGVGLPAAVVAQLGGDAQLEQRLVGLFNRMDDQQLETLFDSLNAVGRVDVEGEEQAEQGNGET